jgi:hypothetical protein
MIETRDRCPDCLHKLIAHSERGCDVGLPTPEGAKPCPCKRTN